MEDYIPSNSRSKQKEPTTPATKAPGINLFDFLSMVDATGNQDKGWMGHCPVHDDTKASLSIAIATSGKVLVNCYVCGPNTQPGLVTRGYWPIHVPNEARLAVHKADSKFTYEWVPKTDGKPPEPFSITGYVVAGMWDYKDLDSELMGRVIRYDSLADPEPGAKRAKQFRPQFMFMMHNSPAWAFKAPTPRPLYNIPSLHHSGTVLLVEGEKTADAAKKIFPTSAVVSPMGGLQGFAKSDLSLLKNRDILIWPDADEKWEEYATAWRNVLVEAHVATVSCVKLPERLVREHPKWDLADEPPEWLDIKKAVRETIAFTISNRDPVGSIKQAEDLKTAYVHLTGTAAGTFIFIETGYEMGVPNFDATFMHLTSWRHLPSPSKYVLGAKDTHRSVISKTYEPGKPRVINTEAGMVYNQYTPPILKPRSGDVSPFIEHIHWLLNEEDATEILCRFANMVQRPHRRPHSAFILQGEQGIGKNMLFESLIPLVGADNFYITDPSSVMSNWNYYVAGRVMVVLNEMTDQERHEMYDILKPIITDEWLEYKAKFKPAYQFRNYSHIFCMTNYERPIRLPSEDERRFYIAEAVPKKAQSYAYYAHLANWLKDNSGPIMHYLLNYDIGDWRPEARPKVTEAKRRVAVLSENAGETRLKEVINDNELTMDLYAKESFIKLLHEKGVISKELHGVSAQRMYTKHGFIELQMAIKNNAGVRQRRIVCVRNQEKYQDMTPTELAHAFNAERSSREEDSY